MKYKYNNEWNTITTDGAPGKDGTPGLNGAPGKNGKSAYEYAKQGGYVGTEEEFSKKLAAGTLVVKIANNNGTLTANKTYSEIKEAFLNGTIIYLYDIGYCYPLIEIDDEFSFEFGGVYIEDALLVKKTRYIIREDNTVIHYEDITDDSRKMDKTNPTGTGSFSLNRKSGSYIGGASHAEGNSTTASGFASHAEGTSTIASGSNSHVQGKYNIEDSSNTYADIIGNGSDLKSRSNAATVDWSGNAWYAGDVYVGSTSGTHKDEGSKKLATEEYVDNSVIVPAPSSADEEKVLRVVGGKATWVSLPSASGVSF